MAMQQAVMLDRESFDTGDLDLSALHALDGVQWQIHEHSTHAQTASRLQEAVIVISNKVELDAHVLEHAAKLKLICIAATGTNNVDLDAARARGIAVCNVRDYATPSVVQHVYAVILALSRHLIAYRNAAQDGRWSDSRQFCVLDAPIEELGGKTLGIIGYGTLGKAVAQLAPSFGLRPVIAQRPGTPSTPGRLPFETVLRESDILSLHCPLTEETRGLIDAAALAQMKPQALLINTARGGIVDEHVLAEALRTGKLGGAAIDVLSTEPPVNNNPLLAPGLPNLILTPHIAWASRAARQRLADQLAQNIRAFVAGSPRHLVN